jgi:hypothetical protein
MLLGAQSFSGFIGHLACHHAIILTFSSRFGLPSIVRTTTPTFLGCWALIARALVIRFQQDDHLIFLDTILHVETNISPF